MVKLRNRKRKAGSRRDKALTAALERNAPNERVLSLRSIFGFVTPTKVEGKVGTIDQDICDGIGQLHALGCLDSFVPGRDDPDKHHGIIHAHDPLDLRLEARKWRNGYLSIMGGQACKTSRLERKSKGHHEPIYTKADERWDLMDGALKGYERNVLHDLLIGPEVRTSDSDFPPWARAIIDEKLLQKGRVNEISRPMRFADANDWALMGAAVRGCVMLVDAKLPQRRAAA